MGTNYLFLKNGAEPEERARYAAAYEKARAENTALMQVIAGQKCQCQYCSPELYRHPWYEELADGLRAIF